MITISNKLSFDNNESLSFNNIKVGGVLSFDDKQLEFKKDGRVFYNGEQIYYECNCVSCNNCNSCTTCNGKCNNCTKCTMCVDCYGCTSCVGGCQKCTGYCNACTSYSCHQCNGRCNGCTSREVHDSCHGQCTSCAWSIGCDPEKSCCAGCTGGCDDCTQCASGCRSGCYASDNSSWWCTNCRYYQ